MKIFSAPAKSLSFAKLAAFLTADGQLIERDGRVGMIRAEQLFLDRERAAKEFICFGELTRLLPNGGEVVEVDGEFVMFRSLGALKDGQRAQIK